MPKAPIEKEPQYNPENPPSISVNISKVNLYDSENPHKIIGVRFDIPESDRNLLETDPRFKNQPEYFFEFVTIGQTPQPKFIINEKRSPNFIFEEFLVSRAGFVDHYRQLEEKVPDFNPLNALEYLLAHKPEIQSIVMPHSVTLRLKSNCKKNE